MQRPRLKSHYVIEVVSPSQVFLLSEDRQFVLQGAAAVTVLPYLDGRRTVGDIAVEAGHLLSIGQVLQALRKYESGGHLAEGRPDLPDHELAYWDSIGVDPAQVATACVTATVALMTVADADAEPFAEALRALRISTKVNSAGAGEPPPDADLSVVIVSDYLDPALDGLNRAFLAAGRPWLIVKPHGVVQWAGPLMRPGETGCWSCLAQRLAGNRQVERILLARRDDQVPFPTSNGHIPTAGNLAADLLAAEIAEILATGTSARLAGTLLTVDRRTLRVAEHTLVRQPQCPACGDPMLITHRDPRVSLHPLDVQYNVDTGYRMASPQETYDRLSKHISAQLGAVSSLTSLTGPDDAVTFAYGASHYFPLGGLHLDLLRKNIRGQSGGKGRTDIQARVSGLAEAIERYCGVWEGGEPVVRAAYDDLGADRAVHPAELLTFSTAQYANRHEWNSRADLLQTVPEPFRADLAVDWTTAWSLTDERPRLVPAAYVWFGHPDLKEQFFTLCDANGNAAGNTLEEAVLQGLCELIERDAVALWWYNRIPRPEVDLDSLNDGYVDLVRRFYRSMDRELWMLDITTDLGVPTFAGVSRRVGDFPDDIVVGFGTHVDARVAMMRAITEVNQFLPFIAERNPDGSTVYSEDESAIIDWLRTTRIDEQPWLTPDTSQSIRRLGDYPLPQSMDLAVMIDELVRRIQAAGMEVLVVDQSRPDIELNVAKVIVPGLRHFWRRLGPGRLYDVPVQLGWLDSPRDEAELNPKSVFF